MMDRRQALEQSLMELELVEECFSKDGKCLNPNGARDYLSNLKDNLRFRAKHVQDATANAALIEALNRLSMRVNSKPDQKWMPLLYDAKSSLKYWLSHS
jgi:hypothetical protein